MTMQVIMMVVTIPVPCTHRLYQTNPVTVLYVTWSLFGLRKAKQADPNTIQLNSEQIKLGNIKTDTLKDGLLGIE